MSANVEIARQGYEDLQAFMRGDLPSEAFAQLLDPEIEWHWGDDRDRPAAPPLRGVPQLIAFLEQSRGAWVDLAMEPREFIEAPDDRVLVSVRQRRPGSEDHFFQLWTIRDEKVHRVEIFRRRAEALEAVGLRE